MQSVLLQASCIDWSLEHVEPKCTPVMTTGAMILSNDLGGVRAHSETVRRRKRATATHTQRTNTQGKTSSSVPKNRKNCWVQSSSCRLLILFDVDLGSHDCCTWPWEPGCSSRWRRGPNDPPKRFAKQWSC